MDLLLDSLYNILASLTYSIISIIVLEIAVSAVYSIDDDGNIKLTFGRIIGDTKYKSSAMFVYYTLFIGIAINSLDSAFQPMIVSKISAIGLETIPLFFASLSFSIFWLTKIFLGRRWKHKMVQMSIIIFVLSISPIILTI